VSRSVSRFLVIAAVTIPLGANLTLPTIASAANGPGISPSADPTVPVNGSATDLRMRRQAILTQLAVPLRDEFETRDSEYSGLAIDPDAGEVTVYFHNKPGPGESRTTESRRNGGLCFDCCETSKVLQDSIRERPGANMAVGRSQ
jgi:hypothetical protein